MEQNVVNCRQVGVDGPVRVDRDQFDLDQAKPVDERLWSAWAGETPTPAPAPAPVTTKVELPKMLVMKDRATNKFLIVNELGQAITNVDGIEAEGYKTQAAATKAIEALNNG